MSKPVTVVIVGAGHRSLLYAGYANTHPDKMRVVAVAEPNEARRKHAAKLFGIKPDCQFQSYLDLANRPKLADAAINGTMDRLHYESTMSLLTSGYHVLLEKPIAPSAFEVRELIITAKKLNRTVMICHVLRYAPFYTRIKELLVTDTIGEIVAMRTSENVSYHHMAVSYIRGRWNNTNSSNPMLLAKCCHDLDIIAWLMSGTQIRKVASFGSLKQFRPENAPKGSARRCLDGCDVESTCQYSAKANYVTMNWWNFYAWECLEHIPNPTVDQKLESLRTNNPFGRCVWHCNNDVVDHQSVLVEFSNGATATHDMFCGTSRPCRTLHIVGTKGEIEGTLEDAKIVVRKPWLEKGREYMEEKVEVGISGDSHGGGDLRLVDDFVSVLMGTTASKGVSSIEDSLTGHLIAFSADVAMRNSRVVHIDAT